MVPNWSPSDPFSSGPSVLKWNTNTNHSLLGAGTVSNLKTVQAFTSEQFLNAWKKAGRIMAKFKPAG